MSTSTIVARLEEGLPCNLDQFSPGVWTTRLPGSRTDVRLDENSNTLRILTPVAGAHDGLGNAGLVELLKLNFPNDVAGQSFFAAGRTAGYLDLVDHVALSSVTPQEAVDRVLDQIRASVEIAERIAEARLGGKPIGRH